ncbi:MAG TPA: hypothetical protein VK099_07345 [Alcanivoracaceae bacterium]|nr:hypothetical protein [Alcanivoracaceae bacterium]
MSNQKSVNVFGNINAYLRQNPLAKYAVGFMIALAAYAAGLMLIGSAMNARWPLVAFAIFFLPAVLRAWMLVYWEVKAGLLREYTDAENPL